MNNYGFKSRRRVFMFLKKGIGALTILSVFTLVLVGFSPIKAVALECNGTEHNMKTNAETVGELLNDVGINLEEHDYVSVPLDTKVTSGMKIVMESAKKITLDIDGVEQTVYTTADTVGEMLEEQFIFVKETDDINPPLDTPIKNGMEVSVGISFPVALNDGGVVTEIYSTSSVTVEEFLAQNNIVLNQYDTVTPALNETLTPGSTVKVTRVNKYQSQEAILVPYTAVENQDPNQYEDYSAVTQQGVDGAVLNTYDIVEVDGQIQQKNLVSSATTVEPIPQVTTVGTKEQPKAPAPAPYVPASTGETVTMTATAYTIPDGQSTATTANGTKLYRDPNQKVIAVDPDVIPLGSTVYVEGYGVAVAADTGGAVNGNKIDVFVPTEEEAIQWGVREVEVQIL